LASWALRGPGESGGLAAAWGSVACAIAGTSCSCWCCRFDARHLCGGCPRRLRVGLRVGLRVVFQAASAAASAGADARLLLWPGLWQQHGPAAGAREERRVRLSWRWSHGSQGHRQERLSVIQRGRRSQCIAPPAFRPGVRRDDVQSLQPVSARLESAAEADGSRRGLHDHSNMHGLQHQRNADHQQRGLRRRL
jgi:hypothetical protein